MMWFWTINSFLAKLGLAWHFGQAVVGFALLWYDLRLFGIDNRIAWEHDYGCSHLDESYDSDNVWGSAWKIIILLFGGLLYLRGTYMLVCMVVNAMVCSWSCALFIGAYLEFWLLTFVGALWEHYIVIPRCERAKKTPV